VTVKTEHRPITSVRRIIEVISVFMVYGKFTQVSAGEFSSAALAHMGKQFKRLCPIPGIPFTLIPL
jgi:hypothetical protein